MITLNTISPEKMSEDERLSEIAYGTAGSGGTQHILSEAFRRAMGIDAIHAPYKGEAPLVADFLGGRLDWYIATPITILPHVQSGKVTEPLQANLSLAGQLLARLARPQQRASWLAPMIEGQIKLAFAFAERQARHEIHDCQTVARREGEGFLLNGRKVSVVGGASAEVFIVLARTSGDQYDTSGLSLFIVPVELDGVSRVCTDTFDGHGSCELRLCNVLVNGHSVLGGIGDGFSASEAAIDFGCVMACSEALGVLEVMLSDTLEYVKQRKQFGRPIGQNQALQHRLVDMHILLQEASQLVRAAVLGLVDDLPIEQQQERVSAAKIHIDHALRSIAQEAVQMHGAIGTTDELRVSHYFRRATAIRLQFGDTNWHTRRMGNLMRQRHVHMGDEARSADL